MGNKAFKGEGHTLGSGGGGARAGLGGQSQNVRSRIAKTKKMDRATSQRQRDGQRQEVNTRAKTSGKSTPKTEKSSKAKSQRRPRTAEEAAAARSAAAAAADARASAWDKRSAKGRRERERKRREEHDRLHLAASSRGGTASASARALHSATHASTAPNVDLGDFDPTQTVMRSSNAVRNFTGTTANTIESRNNGNLGGTRRSSNVPTGSSASVFSSTLLDHHSEVDQNEVARLMPLLTKSSIQQRNEAFAEPAPPASKNLLPENMNEILRICTAASDTTPDLAVALICSHSNRSSAAKAVKMVQTLLANILQNPSDQKYRSVRLCNKAIQRRLCSVPGAISLLVAAGFVLDEKDRSTDPRLVFPDQSSERLEQAITSATLAVSQLES